MKEVLTFRIKARLIVELGERLIKNEKVAMLELIKNSYDADASHVKIMMKDIDDPEKGVIIVEDDGTGMTPDIIKNVWMELGSDYKEKLLKEGRRTPKFRRLPIGEKGIGRFAVHKLGNIVEIITRAENNQEVRLFMDFTSIASAEYLNEAPIEMTTRTPEYFKSSTGTKIIIKKLKKAWTRGMVRDLYRSLSAFVSPFETNNSFKIIFDIDKKEWVEDLPNWDDIKDYALFTFYSKIEGTEIKEFRYEFRPWPSMDKLDGRVVDEKDEKLNKMLKLKDKNGEIDLSRYNIGPVVFRGYVFDMDRYVLNLSPIDSYVIREFLKYNGGVRVYRDGIRVYDYGEPENDWLDLGIRRINYPTRAISKNIIVAAVFLDREKSTDLIEKTNREGFIENEAYNQLKRAILYVLSQIETLRKIDKDKIRTYYGKKQSKEPVTGVIKELKEVVNKKIKEEKLKNELNVYLKRIEKDYNEMRTVYLKAAGAGLTLSIAIHEIDKIILELKRVVKKEKVPERIRSLIIHLSKLIEGYSLFIRKTDRKIYDLKTIIDQALFITEYRFKAHGIEVIKSFKKYEKAASVRCARNLVINSLVNIFDNSIFWLEYSGTINKKIYVDIVESGENPGYISIVIADNGPGMTLPPEEAVKPFMSAKPDGMGLGLHLVDEIMKAHRGMLSFPSASDVNVPPEFSKGAIIMLSFPKEGLKK